MCPLRASHEQDRAAGTDKPLGAFLARLQQQAGSRPADAPARPETAICPTTPIKKPPPPPAGASRTNRHATELDRLHRLLARRPGQTSPARDAVPLPDDVATRHRPADRDLPGRILAPGLRYVERIVDCELPPAEFLPDMKPPQTVRREQLLCFDTETTGLAGGSGTRAFMIGAADWVDGRLRLRQLYLDAMAGETAMLDAFAGWLDADRTLVSYNGRSYDSPLLATRYRLARRINPLAGLGHLDLLYPVRRRYRGCWENCRLVTVERQLLRVIREDDLPGAQAPAAWLGYLRGGSAARLRQVLRHNAQDIISLARLLCVLHPPAAATSVDSA